MNMALRILLCAFVLLAVAPAYAQEDIYTWEPYKFSITLPDRWVAVADGSRLVMGLSADVDRVLAGELASEMVVEVRVVSPPLVELRGRTELEEFVVANRDLALETRTYGTQTFPSVEIPPIAGRRARLVLVADTFLVTASASDDLWETAVPTLDALLGSIQAQSFVPPQPLPLTQHFTWHNISLGVPRDWLMGSMGNNLSFVSMTSANRIFGGASFRWLQLVITVQDYSYLRSLLSPESLHELEAPFYPYDASEVSELEVSDMNGILASSVEFMSGAGRGRAVLLLSRRDAYVLVGFSDAETWATSEAELFEAILATVRIE